MNTVLYSTLFPASLPYFAPFWQSITEQSDKDFDICFALDAVKQNDITHFTKTHSVTFIHGHDDTPASIREKALLELCESYDTVVLVDSDDILLPYRVQAAKQALETHDAYACALELINQEGKALNKTFNCPDLKGWHEFLSKWNVFGFSNTAYRSTILRELFPIPKDTVMVDWLVALKALAKNANLFFDGQAHMLYRQYDNNTARVLSPYTAEQVAKSTALVLKHYEYALNSTVIQEDLSFYVLLEKRQKEVKQFSSLSQKGLEHYITELNKLEDVFLWWECVAHPDLESLWT